MNDVFSLLVVLIDTHTHETKKMIQYFSFSLVSDLLIFLAYLTDIIKKYLRLLQLGLGFLKLVSCFVDIFIPFVINLMAYMFPVKNDTTQSRTN